MEISETAVQRKTHDAHKTVDDLARQATERAGPAIDRVAQAAHSSVDKVAGTVAPAAEWVRESADQLKAQQDVLMESARGYVRDRPLVVLAAALATGFIIGRLAR